MIGFVTISLPQLQNATICSIKNSTNSTEDFVEEIGSPIAPISKEAEIDNATHATEGENHLCLDQDLGSWFAAALLLAGLLFVLIFSSAFYLPFHSLKFLYTHIIGIPFTPLGGLLGGIFGRRKIILLCQPLGIISWIIMANAQNIPTLFFSRFLASVAITCHIASPG